MRQTDLIYQTYWIHFTKILETVVHVDFIFCQKNAIPWWPFDVFLISGQSEKGEVLVFADRWSAMPDMID